MKNEKKKISKWKKYFRNEKKKIFNEKKNSKKKKKFKFFFNTLSKSIWMMVKKTVEWSEWRIKMVKWRDFGR